MIMKSKHRKNTGQMVRRVNWKITKVGKLPGGGGGQTGQIARGAKETKNCTGGALPLSPHSYSPPLRVHYTNCRRIDMLSEVNILFRFSCHQR